MKKEFSCHQDTKTQITSGFTWLMIIAYLCLGFFTYYKSVRASSSDKDNLILEMKNSHLEYTLSNRLETVLKLRKEKADLETKLEKYRPLMIETAAALDSILELTKCVVCCDVAGKLIGMSPVLTDLRTEILATILATKTPRQILATKTPRHQDTKKPATKNE